MLDNIWVLVQAPVLNLQLLVDGVFIGAIFVLIAYGLGLVWGVMNVKNLAQGDFVIMGGYIAWTLSNPRYMGDYAVHPILGLPVAIENDADAAALFDDKLNRRVGWVLHEIERRGETRRIDAGSHLRASVRGGQREADGGENGCSHGACCAYYL